MKSRTLCVLDNVAGRREVFWRKRQDLRSDIAVLVAKNRLSIFRRLLSYLRLFASCVMTRAILRDDRVWYAKEDYSMPSSVIYPGEREET